MGPRIWLDDPYSTAGPSYQHHGPNYSTLGSVVPPASCPSVHSPVAYEPRNAPTAHPIFAAPSHSHDFQHVPEAAPGPTGMHCPGPPGAMASRRMDVESGIESHDGLTGRGGTLHSWVHSHRHPSRHQEARREMRVNHHRHAQSQSHRSISLPRLPTHSWYWDHPNRHHHAGTAVMEGSYPVSYPPTLPPSAIDPYHFAPEYERGRSHSSMHPHWQPKSSTAPPHPFLEHLDPPATRSLFIASRPSIPVSPGAFSHAQPQLSQPERTSPGKVHASLLPNGPMPLPVIRVSKYASFFTQIKTAS
ncbi:hypothetical protein BCR44DRAFT_26056 [Catenaria anguillulae PL171]|uniref:Uncharacterized protein n=1 Tax=Catenaria anguillulae PL171 TaxID=765915 RepID=A0A1Y2HTT9_9FUNG|nr:hypothetical protein BCR44DRAFT_26056 [Catenaria anguillulae PL171]